MKLLKNTQSGRSMVEMLGVLAIIGVLSVGGIAGYSKAMFKYQLNQTIDILSHAFSRLVELDGLNLRSTYIGNDNADIAKYGIIPECDTSGPCQLPLKNVTLSIQYFYEVEFNNNIGEVFINISGDNREKTCSAILSAGLHEIYPDDWWSPVLRPDMPGAIAVENQTLYTKYPLPENPELNTLTAARIAEACKQCIPSSDLILSCTITYGIRVPY